MKTLLLLFTGIFFLSFDAGDGLQKKLIGHWTSEKDLVGIEAGDTVRLVKRKFDDKLYQWGSGVAGGYTFDENGDFSEYMNMLCSTESDPVRYQDEHWKVSGDTITIAGERREMIFVVMKNAEKKMLELKVVKGGYDKLNN